MIKVLIDTGNAPSTTGIGVYSRGLLHALDRFASDKLVATESGVSTGGKTIRPIRRMAYLLRLRRLASKNFLGADLVHFTNIYVPKRHRRVAYVATIHDLNVLESPEAHTYRYSMYYRRAVLNAIERADSILTDTNAVRNMMLDRYRISEEKISAIGIGLNPEFQETVDDIPMSATNGKKTLLFVGRLESKKNVTWLVHTFSEAVRSGRLQDVELVLAGNRGYGFESIAKAIAQADRLVHWVSNPSLKSLASLYRRAEVVVLPSLCEGFGLPLLEAMYCDKPIVASRIPTSVEVAGTAAEFFSLDNKEEFWDALDAALVDRNAQLRRAARARQLDKYSWERLTDKYVKVYESACSKIKGNLHL